MLSVSEYPNEGVAPKTVIQFFKFVKFLLCIAQPLFLHRFCVVFSYEFNNAGSNFLYKFSVFYCFHYVIFIFSNSHLQGIAEGFFKLSFAAFLKLQQGDNPIRFFLGFC